MRVTAQLIDAETGNHIWAERYDRALEDVFAVQDEITSAVVTAIQPAVADAELRRALRKPPESLGAWEAYQRGLWHVGQASSRTITSGRSNSFSGRSRSMPTSRRPTWRLARLILTMRRHLERGHSEDAASMARSRARKAVAIDPEDADAQAMVACTALCCWQCGRGVRSGVYWRDRSTRTRLWHILIEAALLLIHTGEPVQARQRLDSVPSS